MCVLWGHDLQGLRQEEQSLFTAHCGRRGQTNLTPSILGSRTAVTGKELKSHTKKRHKGFTQMTMHTIRALEVEALISIICFVYCDGAEFKWAPLPNSDVKLITFPTLLCAKPGSAPPTKNGSNFQDVTDKDDKNGKDKYTIQIMHPRSVPPTKNATKISSSNEEWQ